MQRSWRARPRPRAGWEEKISNTAAFGSDCPGCKITKLFRWYVKWDDNGTIVIRLHPVNRVVLVESELLGDIFRRIEESMGVPIKHIVFEAERAAAKATIDAIVPKNLAWATRNRLVMHPVSRLFQLLARQAGLADAHTIYYHVYKGSMAVVRNPFNREIFAAMVVGAFESAENVVYDYDWIEIGGKLYLIILPAEQKSFIAERMAPEMATPLPGCRPLEKCPRCGLPKALRHLEWDPPNAVITDTRRGVRMSFVDGYAFSVVFRELVSELGDEIAPIIIEASREYEQRSLRETGFAARDRGRETTYDGFLDNLPVCGQGNPVERVLAPGSLSVTIENPYSVHLLAGQLLAVYETVEGRSGRVEFGESAAQRVKIDVGPKA